MPLLVSTALPYVRYGFQYPLPTKKTWLSHCPPLKTEQLKVKGFRVKLIRTLCSMLWGKSVHRGLLLHWLSSYSIHVNYRNTDLGSRYCRHPNMITSLHPVLQSIDITRRTLTLITLWAPHLFGALALFSRALTFIIVPLFLLGNGWTEQLKITPQRKTNSYPLLDVMFPSGEICTLTFTSSLGVIIFDSRAL